MTQQRQSSDEQVYQDNKREVKVTEVYTNDPGDAAQVTQASPGAQQDEAVAETFPASDPVTSSASAAVPSAPVEEDGAG